MQRQFVGACRWLVYLNVLRTKRIPGHLAKCDSLVQLDPQKKRPHCWGHSSKEAKGRKCQERRCKGPIRQPDRLRVRSRERRVKVKRGLFSYLLEEHLPRQKRRFPSQLCSAPSSLCKHVPYRGFRSHSQRLLNPRPGQNNAHSCTLAAGHYFGPGNASLKPDRRNHIRVASTSCPRPCAACPAGSDRVARVR